MAEKKNKIKISDITDVQELFFLKDLVENLYDYYDNQFKANEGTYNTSFQEQERNMAKEKCDLYLKYKSKILATMENIANQYSI